jgi:hypothetical protein
MTVKKESRRLPRGLSSYHVLVVMVVQLLLR